MLFNESDGSMSKRISECCRVLPDVNSRLCEFAVISQNSSGNSSDPGHYAVAIVHLRQLMCDLSIVWLVWAIAQIVGINLVFYGIKNIRWRFLGTGVLGCLIAILTFSAISEENNTAHIIGLIFVALLVVFWIYSTVTECWCAHFVKRSQETGFSISVARPIGPATISLSEREAPASGILTPIVAKRSILHSSHQHDNCPLYATLTEEEEILKNTLNKITLSTWH
ncbi:hypothetical protein ANCDUO_16086 [Ancylostoma duodenale]|uniref:Uncharacterized protein n=1 Tax=Ancylostoma duodenale TaxID=51022 RepID=A0A0C2G4A3_9BILA|nr:hypothetical protein ANCDUO_16086 [Ancylostoma duodenale]